MVRPAREVDQPTYEIVGTVERYDPRDQPDAWSILLPGTPEYEEYYSSHPEHKEGDDERKRVKDAALKRNWERDPVNPQLVAPMYYSQYALSLESVVDGTILPAIQPDGALKRVDVDPEKMARKIKAFGTYLGAAKVRITRLKQEWVKTHVEYPSSKPYGKPVEPDYENIVCMAFTQNPEMIKCGISTANRLEVGWKYANASLASVIIAHFIRCTGWRARALPTYNSPYLVVPTFVDAGIGEQGRCAFVVTKEFGNNFRPGAVATDMPLALDKPVDFGLQDFCEKCQVCADYCPPGAITHGEKEVIRGVRRWPVDSDKCHRYWDRIGGDCSICQAVCPWNHPNNLLHDTVRELAQNFPSLRKFLIRGESVIYGKYKPARQPEWLTTKGTMDASGESNV